MRRLLRLSTAISSEMELAFILEVEQLLELSRLMLNVDKSELIFRFQFLFLCSVSPEVRPVSGEIRTSMEKEE